MHDEAQEFIVGNDVYREDDLMFGYAPSPQPRTPPPLGAADMAVDDRAPVLDANGEQYCPPVLQDGQPPSAARNLPGWSPMTVL